MLSIIIVAYKPEIKRLKNILTLINKKIKIILINNSESSDLNKIKFKNNIKIIKSKNNGNGAAINLGLKNVKTKYAMYLDIDVEFRKNFVGNITNLANKINNFGILVPNHGNLKSTKDKIEKYDGEGSIMFFNLNVLKKKNLFDENYFLYFEEQDLFYFCKKNSIKVFFLPRIQIKHFRASSVSYAKKNLTYLRSWHYAWSMFFFYKKNFNYFTAIKKTFLIFFKDLLMVIFYLISFDIESLKIRFFRLYGFISSMLGFKSFLRP